MFFYYIYINFLFTVSGIVLRTLSCSGFKVNLYSWSFIDGDLCESVEIDLIDKDVDIVEKLSFFYI